MANEPVSEKRLAGILEDIVKGRITSYHELDEAKRRAAESEGSGVFPRNSDILRLATPQQRKVVLSLLKKKPTRTASGVAVVAVMTRPTACPHGRCAYCPGGVAFGVPQSYSGKEPSTLRAIRYGYDPYLIVTMRLAQLETIGHPVDKVEVVVQGGTLTAQPMEFQEEVVSSIYAALNDYGRNKKKFMGEDCEKYVEEYFNNPYVAKGANIEYLKEANEKAAVRCVGLDFEPKPEYAKGKVIDDLLRFGVTRVEMGVQAPDDELYKKVNRGHTVQDVVDSTQQLKDAAYKVAYHMMPGLNGVNPVYDVWAAKTVFEDSRFRPDHIKIYPLLVMKHTQYYERWKSGEYTPYDTETAVPLIAEIKRILPTWVRTMRINRDIPVTDIAAGIKNSNLGQLVSEYMHERGIQCKCIRCREVYHKLPPDAKVKPEELKIKRTDYEASEGKEVFLSFENEKYDALFAFIRLRAPHNPTRPEITKNTGLIRELHVYGPMVEVGEKPLEEWQHRGLGRELLAEVERIAREEFGFDRMIVISAAGTRDYYRKLGYERAGPYMGKKLV
ncbi:Uncharacterised protein [uncultured archaeon]|nr:Uncharacterised protein [uncultured archaeon]